MIRDSDTLTTTQSLRRARPGGHRQRRVTVSTVNFKSRLNAIALSHWAALTVSGRRGFRDRHGEYWY